MDQDAQRVKTFECCRHHMVEAVRACDISNDPFPHFMFRGFFPDEIYETALKLLPAREHYDSYEYGKKARNDQGTRWRFDLTNKALANLDPLAQGFWLGVRDALGCVDLKRVVFQKLAAGIAFRNSIPEREAAELAGYPWLSIFREEQGYRIPPHPDTNKKIVTMQIALPTDESQEHIGTQFYRRSLNPFSFLREPRGFEIVKIAPFVPNAAYAFVVLNNLTLRSWHGRTTLDSMAGVRNSILNIWNTKPEHGHPDIVREHYQIQKPGQKRRAA